MAAPIHLTVVIPTFNEADQIRAAMQSLAPLQSRLRSESLIADGGSCDGTAELAAESADAVIHAPRGRALQMNLAAAQAKGRHLLFLHADTRVCERSAQALERQIARDAVWGRFDVRLSGARPLLRLVERLMNLRSRLTGIATGDQAMFVRREVFEQVGGFPAIPLMEDIALSRRLKAIAPPVCLREPVLTSSRRWEQRGIGNTILLMWRLRLLYFFGADPHHLAREYHRDR